MENRRKILTAYKFNILAIATHHRKYCEGEGCIISLNLLRQMVEDLGIKFTKKQMEKFL